ncbi:Lrp/AsnC family transcriptional regulator [Virgibacillus xinjiangensis]|uniref:Lrp/AsnC family transcriptional regulator n=1 Tax=Virgibacillus xinjiangensis TaxID=393090 RepID=A0ABV7CXB4_9BACI
MLDHTDIRILEELSKNSRIKMKELGRKVHLTGQAASDRVAKLEESGVIEGYTINVNKDKLGYMVHAFITIITQTLNHQPYLSFIKTRQTYVLNHYKISGDGCYMLECKFPDNASLNSFLEELNGYANYKLSMVVNKQ